MQHEFYAHSAEGKSVEEWRSLEEHLMGTAERAGSFASEFGCGERLAGLWHDLGSMHKKALCVYTTK